MSQSSETVRIAPEKLEAEFNRILLRHGFPVNKANTIASVFTSNTLEGVYTHGINRFPRFIDYVKRGYVIPGKEAVTKHQSGAIEQWDGQMGPGITNALLCADRAMELARSYGMGCVALANTNHWMRGGTYGWKAARAGFVFIGWTNTIANMPAWGGIDSKLGNNPLVIGVPYKDDAIVLDMAMSQYSYGALEQYKMKGELLPVSGGYDRQGNLTTDPSAILESQRVLPVGYWKGAGLSFLLDILAALLSAGLSTSEISKRPSEISVSQIFVAIDISRLPNHSAMEAALNSILADYRESVPDKNARIRYPGENVRRLREENATRGIPVLGSVWREVQDL